MPIFRAAEPWRANSTTLGTSAAIIPAISATGTDRPTQKPRSSASFTSPMPTPRGDARAARVRGGGGEGKGRAPGPGHEPLHARLGRRPRDEHERGRGQDDPVRDD